VAFISDESVNIFVVFAAQTVCCTVDAFLVGEDVRSDDRADPAAEDVRGRRAGHRADATAKRIFN
jgi:hypothetical protein